MKKGAHDDARSSKRDHARARVIRAGFVSRALADPARLEAVTGALKLATADFQPSMVPLKTDGNLVDGKCAACCNIINTGTQIFVRKEIIRGSIRAISGSPKSGGLGSTIRQVRRWHVSLVLVRYLGPPCAQNSL